MKKFIAPALVSLSAIFVSTAATAQTAQFENPLEAQICEGDRARVQDDINIISMASDALARSTDPAERRVFQGYIDASTARIEGIVDGSVDDCFGDVQETINPNPNPNPNPKLQ